LGSLIADELVRMGHKVSGLDFVQPATTNDTSRGYQFILADITRPETLPLELRRTSILIHCAALVHRKSSDLSRENYFKVNCEGTRNLLSALDPECLQRIIFMSTVSVYGDSDSSRAPDERTPSNPIDDYGESKVAAEEEIRTFSRENHIPHTIFRLAPVYGRRFLMNLEKRVLLPKRIAFFKIGDGSQRISMAAAGNVVQAVCECLRMGIGCDDTFILKDREDNTINEVISALRFLYKRPRCPIVRIPRKIPLWMSAFLRRVASKKGSFYSYQLGKISGSAIYSGEKLFAAGVDLPWNLKKTLLRNETVRKMRPEL
jgi:nucleoside-diphosphate-sugar epimerase